MSSFEENLISNMKEITKNKCSSWIESQKEILYPIENNFYKRKEPPDYSDHETDSEFNSVSESGGKRRRLGTVFKKEVLSLKCEWSECFFQCDSMKVYMEHVSNHITVLGIRRIVEEDREVYVCGWKSCSYENDVVDEIRRHVNYHCYHGKLKCIGSNVRGRVKLPKCHRDTQWINSFDLPPPHLCRWEECLEMFLNFEKFLYHVAAHVETNPRGNKVEGGVKCRWTGCDNHCLNIYKLRNHMRHHTKEKLVACPDCGSMFASNAKFYDHCRRQIPIDVQGFQCSHCNKFYATEGILRNHMRLHVFTQKCSMCDMTCESPASLAKHIRYRHLSARPYPCQLCSHAAKSQQDLDSHMTVHTKGPNFLCNVERCQYQCKNAYSLDRHIEKNHSSEIRWYCCRDCPIKYRKSYRLTKHLLETHNLQWPSGHCRFQYVREEDGCYRVQIFRYESYEENETANLTENIDEDNKEFEIEVDEKSEFPKVQVVECNKTMDESLQKAAEPADISNCNKSMPIISNILISIDQMDADGNIVESKVVEAQEMKMLPSLEEPALIITENCD